MVKKHRIIKAYNVMMWCDECGAQMLPSELNIGTAASSFTDCTFTSKCPNCGFSVNTGKTQYPHTQIEFDLKGEEIE